MLRFFLFFLSLIGFASMAFDMPMGGKQRFCNKKVILRLFYTQFDTEKDYDYYLYTTAKVGHHERFHVKNIYFYPSSKVTMASKWHEDAFSAQGNYSIVQ